MLNNEWKMELINCVIHLLNANALFNAYIWLSTFLLGCGSPYMGTSFSGPSDKLPPRT